MARWVLGMVVVVGAGAVTLWQEYLLESAHMVGQPAPDVGLGWLAASGLPTALFLAAGLLRRRSVATLVAVAVLALAVGVLRVEAIQHDLSMPRTMMTGVRSFLAWAIGLGVAGVAFVIAGVAWLLDNRRPHPASVDAGPNIANRRTVGELIGTHSDEPAHPRPYPEEPLGRQPHRRPHQPIWSAVVAAATMLVLILLLRFSVVGIALISMGDTAMDGSFYGMLRWATWAAPLAAGLLVYLRERPKGERE